VPDLAGRARCSERSPLHDVRQHASAECPRGTWADAKRSFADEFSPGWWSQTGSNRRPPACKAGALPTELWPLFAAANSGRRPQSERPPASASLAARQPSYRRARRAEAAERRRLVGLGRLELPTSRLSSARSNQLSYKPNSFEQGFRTAADVTAARARP
jgi:hypothetical protein